MIMATCEDTADDLVTSSVGCPRLASIGSDDARAASESICTDDIEIALIVPIAEVAAASVVDAVAGCSVDTMEGVKGGEGGSSMALVCICGASSMAVEVVGSVEVMIDSSWTADVDVAAVRARERVHRFPFTVVIDP